MFWQLFAVDPAKLSPWERMLARAALVVSILALLWTLHDLRVYSGIDLRNRVVGARVMLAGHDPYAFVWEAGMPDQWLDPVYDPLAHRLTISPPTLLLYSTIARLPFKSQRVVSFVAEWLALILSLALLSRSLSTDRLRLIFLVGASFFFVAGDIWRIHLERGQIYVYLLLLMSLAIRHSANGGEDSALAGVWLGLLALLRPNLGLVLVGLLLRKQWNAAIAMCVTLAVGLAATFAVVPTTTWKSYREVGEQYYRALDDPDADPIMPRPTFEMIVEDVDFAKSLTAVESSSFGAACSYLQKRTDIIGFDIGKASKGLLVVLAIMLIGTLMFRRGIDTPTAFALTLIVALDSDLFLPHRWVYVDIVLLAPLALLLPRLVESNDAALGVAGVVIVGLFLGLVGTALDLVYLATLVRAWLVLGALTVAAATQWDREPTPPIA